MSYQEKIVDATTGEVTFRPFTKEEIAKVETVKAKIEKELVESINQANRKAVLLAKLGITEDEAKLLLS